MSVQLGLVVTEMGLRYLHYSSPGRLYIRALIPLLTSLSVHHSGECIKQMQLSDERRKEWPRMLFDEFGPEPRSGCWETCQSERKTAAETSTLRWVGRIASFYLSTLLRTIRQNPCKKSVCNVSLLQCYIWHIYHPHVSNQISTSAFITAFPVLSSSSPT